MNKHFLNGALALGVSAIAAVVSIQPAEAMQVNIGFGGSGPQPGNFPGVPSLDFIDPVSGLKVTATATDETGTARNVFQFNGGLGVTTPGDLAWNGRSTQIDGFGPDEILNLSFDKTVRLISAKFGAVGRNDDFSLTVDDLLAGFADIPSNNIYTFAGTYISQEFGFSTRDFRDDYYLRSVKVEIIPTPAAVLPALAGIGTAALRRKKREQEELQDA